LSEATRAVFISYASQDAVAAERVCGALRAAGIEVWFDRNELRGGDAWDKKIRRQIRECALFLALVSAQTDARPEGYFRLEWKLAVDRSQLIADDEPYLIPIVIDDTVQAQARVPDRFREYQWTRLPAGATSDAFVHRVQQLLGSDRRPVAAAARVGAAAQPPRSPSRRYGAMLVAAGALLVAVAGYFAITHQPAHPVGGERAAPKPVATGPSVAVLPFVDLSERKDQEYFADGLSEELIGLLAKIQGLHVPARTSSFYFKHKQATLQEIARALVVQHVLEGSVRKSGKLLRIAAHLVRADTGDQVWSQTYDRPLTDVFKVQDEIAARVVDALKVALVSAASVRTPPTVSGDAYTLYLQARALVRSAGAGDFTAAQQTLKRALALDPKFAVAWAELAQAYTGEFGWHDGIDHAVACTAAREAADQALTLDPKLMDAHRAKAVIIKACQGSPAAAEVEFKEALALDPADASILHTYAWWNLSQGRFDDALRYAQEAVSRDPLNPWVYFPLAWAQSSLGKTTEAEASYRRMVEIDPTVAGVHGLHANSLLGVHRPRDALAEVNRENDDQFRQMNLPLVYDALGRTADADREIKTFILKYGERDPMTVMEFYACRGDVDSALPWLKRVFDGGGIKLDDDLPNRVSCLQGIEKDPRYQALVRKAPPKIHFP
jgi:TolB-like protein/Tfp pilus assembly protein PilF